MDSLAPQAIELLNRGWPIVPSRGTSKGPCVRWKSFQSAHPTTLQIEQWEAKFHPDRWGTVTGQILGMIGIDFDGETGLGYMKTWGLDPHVQTPSGGYHVYVRWPGWRVPTLNAKSSGVVWKWKGVDVRGDGGYINLLGSSEKGRYVILREIIPYEFDQIPTELGNFLFEWSAKANEEPDPDQDPEVVVVPASNNSLQPAAELLISRALDQAPATGRNNAGMWLACQLRDSRFSESEAISVVLAYRSRTGPTNARGEREAYTEDEARASVGSAYNSPPRDPWPHVPGERKRHNGHANVHVGALPSPEPVPEIDHESYLKAEVAKIIEAKDVSLAYQPAFIKLCVMAGRDSTFEAQRELEKAFKKEFRVGGEGAFKDRIKTLQRSMKPEVIEPPPSAIRQVLTSNRQLRDISRDAIKATADKNDPPSLFVRSGALVHVIQDEHERPSVSIVTEARLRGVIARTCDFMKHDRFGDLQPTFPPIDVVRDVLAFNPITWPFPKLHSVVEVPVLRPDGTVLDQSGYDRASGIYYAPASNLESFPLPEKPTIEDVVKARAVIEDIIGEFPYADTASKANLYGLLLTPVLRPAISGRAPLAVVDAPAAGTGKSLLIDVLSVITTGRPAAMMPYPYKEEEMQKQIAASMAAGRQLIVFDNLEGELRSPALCLAITANEFEARILGVSRNMTVANVSTWVVTGNNIKPAGDMPRRCYQIRLNAKDSQPYSGRKFKHPDLLKHVTQNRSKVLHALLVLARYWFASGSPNHIAETVGSFEEWHRVTGSVIRHAQISGFLSNYKTFIENEDESPRQWGEFLAATFRYFPTEHELFSAYFSAGGLVDAALSDELKNNLPAEISDCLEKKGNHRISVGKMLRSRRERRFRYDKAQYWLERETDRSTNTDHKGSSLWRVCMSIDSST